MTFRPRYALALFVLVLVELAIAQYTHDRWVRPYLGDVLAVVGVYCAVRTLTRIPPRSAAGFAFALGCAIEGLQACQLGAWLGLRPGSLWAIALGTTFDPWDLLAYGIGLLAIVACDPSLLSARRGRRASELQALP